MRPVLIPVLATGLVAAVLPWSTAAPAAAPAPAAPVDTPADATAGDVAAEEIPADEQAPEVGSEQAAEVAAENTDAEFPGSHAPLESGEAPEGFEVKGNADSGLYHEPDGQWYDQTVAEFYFKTAEDAEAAGFARAGGGSASDSDNDGEESK